jgi:serine/threonine protein kinase/WD40 repeat protein
MTESITTDTSALEALMADVADDFVRRRRRGERVDPEDYARRYPEHARLIRQVLSSLEMLGQSGVGPPAPERGEAGSDRLGDFRLLREIGRGGMGIVYEAVELSLGRRVALKVLPFTGALDPRQLQRFRNEAQAAAQLHHAHIVPVYSVGVDRGMHFFAMQYIEGTTLAGFLDRLRQGPGASDTLSLGRRRGAPSVSDHTPPPATRRALNRFRWVARLGVQAAEALEHAHQQGVVHRDIKPSNLLLDTRGELWVTDFGLARSQACAGLTATGDMVGTLRYMSPEQALGKPVLVDHRTDVYSLGLTLYELLTLTPAFPASGRGALLRAIAQDEPTPPRRVEPALPIDLETIVLKAMAKAPEHRYASAGEMALDLERFLGDRPILARPPSLLQRARRWARRRRSLALSLAVSLVLLVAGAFCSTGIYALQKRRHAQTLEVEKERTNENYYRALVSRATALRLGRVPGYRAGAWASLKEAASLDVPGKDLAVIRAEALACLGDPVGLGKVPPPANPRKPPVLPEAFDWIVRLHQRPRYSLRVLRNSPRAVSPDGAWFAFVDPEVGLTLWESAWKFPKVAAATLGGVYDLAFTPDGRLIVAGCEEGLAVWQVPDLQPWSFVRGGNVFSVATHPWGRLAAAAGQRLELWSLSSNRLIVSLPSPAHGTRVGFSDDGKLLLALGPGGVPLAAWPVTDTPEKKQLAGHRAGAPAVAFSPNGKLLASGGKDGSVKILDARTGAVRHRCEGHARANPGGIEALDFSPDGALLASADYQGVLVLWDTSRGSSVAWRAHQRGRIWRVRFDRTGGLLVAGMDRGVVVSKVVRRPGSVTLVEERFVPVSGLIDLALAPSGKEAVVLDRSGRLRVLSWGAKPFERLLPLRARNQVRSLHFDQGGRRFTFITPEGRLATCEWGAGEARRVRTTDQPASAVALHGGGRWAAVAVPGHGITVYDLESKAEWLPLPPEGSDVWGLAWSPDATRLALSLSDGGVAVWDLEEVRSALGRLGLAVPSTAEPLPEPPED